MRESKEQHDKNSKGVSGSTDTLRKRVKGPFHISKLISIISEPLASANENDPNNNESLINEGLGIIVKAVGIDSYKGSISNEKAMNLINYWSMIAKGLSEMNEFQNALFERMQSDKPLAPNFQVIEDRLLIEIKDSKTI